MLNRSERTLELLRLRRSLEKVFARPTLVLPRLRYVDGRLIAVEEKKEPVVH